MTAAAIATPSPVRKLGLGLIIGIVFLPWLFAWFTLRRGHSTVSRVVSLGWAALIILAAILPHGSTTGTAGSASAVGPTAQISPPSDAKTSNGSAAPEKATEPASKWEYSEQKDEMRGTTTKFAILTSENSVNLDAPYGSHTGDLQLRRRPQDGLQILLRVQGQFLCNAFNNEHVSVKFDDKPIQRFGCSEPNDASTGLLFIDSPARFLSQAKKAKMVVIEAPYFQNGRQQLTFDIEGLKF